MAAHSADGFGLTFTSRTSWKAKITKGGRLVSIAPVTWTKGYKRNASGTGYVAEVWFSNKRDLDAALVAKEPFLVAMAMAKDYQEHPHKFAHFTGVFEVISTGEQLSPKSIQTAVVRRVKAGDVDA